MTYVVASNQLARPTGPHASVTPVMNDAARIQRQVRAGERCTNDDRDQVMPLWRRRKGYGFAIAEANPLSAWPQQ
ncbi:hypothetical protein [Sphingomonas glacialis]|uniref:hypothetical protein n=1 Tax=Sphingomonas glacialis TaxID=658225 RepID=UPI00112E82EF|nr:hypothetical protein [Sphingomonas glacialis]